MPQGSPAQALSCAKLVSGKRWEADGVGQEAPFTARKKPARF